MKLVHAMVDILSTNGNLELTICAMEMSKMLVQAMWPKQSPLLQLPGFDTHLVESLKKEGVVDIPDFMNMEDDIRKKLLPIPQAEMERLASICNRYPFVAAEVSFPGVTDLKTAEFQIGDEVDLVVTLSRDDDEEENNEADEEDL
jgi:pre-mRNA-splicing helicase BRR2